MGDCGAAPGTPGAAMAETLGLAMARRAASALSWQRGALTGPDGDPERRAADDAIFAAVLAAANECLGRFDRRPAADRWCDALLHVLRLAESDAPC